MIREERALLERIGKTNRLHGLFREGDRLLLALSGGPDSAALAALLASIRDGSKLKLFGIHVHHGLSSQAGAFERAARLAAERLAIPLHTVRVDVASLARRKKISIEEAGRLARYECFVKRARRLAADAVVTAHTRDDQVETLLFRIFRGTSLRGLAGIPYSRREGQMRLIRPVLDCEKSELAACARRRKIPFCTDRSNRSGRHTRNRIRHELLPLLEKRLNPRVREAVIRLHNSWLELSPVMARAVDEAWASCRARRMPGTLTLDRNAFLSLEHGLRQEVFLRAVDALGAGRKAVGRVHAEAAHGLPAKGGQASTHFPGFTVTTGPRRIVWRLKHVR